MRDDKLRDQLNAVLGDIPVEGETVSTELLQSITARIGSSIEPVKALPPVWALTAALVTSIIGIAAAGAAILGFHGIRAMSVGDAAAILCSLALFAAFAALSCVQLGIPGSPRRVNPSVLLMMGTLGLAGLFAIVFNDYGTQDFVAQGTRCLVAGLVQAAPAGLLIWITLKRCFPVDVQAAMLARGTLAGLAGVIMLELHCPRLQVPHLAVWHTAVLPVSAIAGLALAVAVFRQRR